MRVPGGRCFVFIGSASAPGDVDGLLVEQLVAEFC